ncbi:hypothetical protein WN55_05581 [Dufourea novaeangliae]|uniref:Uncharacterized protein n=1 Tax=Dufourea novaeangliae TaxID=178035 RepID=A0A154PN17_DUFNO|nr:hypothetical protein WN55_05581 [Dufourea novaeangliae]
MVFIKRPTIYVDTVIASEQTFVVTVFLLEQELCNILLFRPIGSLAQDIVFKVNRRLPQLWCLSDVIYQPFSVSVYMT